MTLKLLDESYLGGKLVTDFIEIRKDEFFVTALDSTCFYVIKRPEISSALSSLTTTTRFNITSMHPNYISMGLKVVPTFETIFVAVRDRRGI